MYSKYERRTDTRTYEDRRKLYEGVSYYFGVIKQKFFKPSNVFLKGWEVIRAEHLNQLWKEKYDEWLKRPKSESSINF